MLPLVYMPEQIRRSLSGVLTDIDNVPSHVREAAKVQRPLWRDPTWRPS